MQTEGEGGLRLRDWSGRDVSETDLAQDGLVRRTLSFLRDFGHDTNVRTSVGPLARSGVEL